LPRCPPAVQDGPCAHRWPRLRPLRGPASRPPTNSARSAHGLRQFAFAQRQLHRQCQPGTAQLDPRVWCAVRRSHGRGGSGHARAHRCISTHCGSTG
jgi:hypothetical protein